MSQLRVHLHHPEKCDKRDLRDPAGPSRRMYEAFQIMERPLKRKKRQKVCRVHLVYVCEQETEERVANPQESRTLLHSGQESVDTFQSHHLRSEEHTSELQSLRHLVCRLLLE